MSKKWGGNPNSFFMTRILAEAERRASRRSSKSPFQIHFLNPHLRCILPSLRLHRIFRRTRMRRIFLIFFALAILMPVAHASPGSVRCGKLLDVHSGRMLTDQVIVFDADGVITAV